MKDYTTDQLDKAKEAGAINDWDYDFLLNIPKQRQKYGKLSEKQQKHLTRITKQMSTVQDKQPVSTSSPPSEDLALIKASIYLLTEKVDAMHRDIKEMRDGL